MTKNMTLNNHHSNIFPTLHHQHPPVSTIAPSPPPPVCPHPPARPGCNRVPVSRGIWTVAGQTLPHRGQCIFAFPLILGVNFPQLFFAACLFS